MTKKICFIAGQLGLGGAERQLYYYIKALKENGWEPYILCLTQGEFWEQQIKNIGVPIFWVGNNKSRIIRLFTITKQIKKICADVIHSQNFHTNIYAYFSGMILNKPYICSLRNDVYSEISNLGILGKISFFFPKNFVANSLAAIDNAEKLGKKREQIYHLPNFIDENFFVPKKKSMPNKKIRIVFIGTLWPPKRVDRIVRIAYICYQKGAELEFYIYGDGDQKSMLIEMAKKLGILNKNLYFMGSITDTRVAYQSSDIFLLTSEHEGTPNVILEAMSCGLPVVSTMVGGVPQLIVDGVNGFLIDPLESEYSYANRLLELAEKSAVRKKMGKINREIIIEKYGLNNVFKKLSDLYTLITISHYKNRN